MQSINIALWRIFNVSFNVSYSMPIIVKAPTNENDVGLINVGWPHIRNAALAAKKIKAL